MSELILPQQGDQDKWQAVLDFLKVKEIPFCPHEPFPKQQAFLRSNAMEVLFGGRASGGKLLPVIKEILTTEGWSTIGDLKVGDFVYDHNGEPTEVLAKSEILYEKNYLVTMVDGEEIIAGVNHYWNITTEENRFLYHLHSDVDVWDFTEVLTTSDLKSILTDLKERVFIPNGKPIPGGEDMITDTLPTFREVESIEPTSKVPMQCIQVDNPRGLFRVGRTFNECAAICRCAWLRSFAVQKYVPRSFTSGCSHGSSARLVV